jgi:hypothetical protein
LFDKDNLEWVVEFAEGGKIGKSKLKVNEKSLEDQSNWFSDIFLFYLSPLLRLGAMKLLEDVQDERNRLSAERDNLIKINIKLTEDIEKIKLNINKFNTSWENDN